MRKRREKPPEEVRDDARWFAEARSVLEGGIRPAIEPMSLKMFGFLFSGGCDAVVSREEFIVRFTWNAGRNPYFVKLAPTVLGCLLQWSGVVGRCSELRAVTLAPHRLKLLRFSAFSADEPRLFWLLDAGEQIRFALRIDSPELRGAGWPPEIPVESAEKVYRDLHPPRPCPHCAVSLSHVRDLGTAMICGSCGRSFPSWKD